MACKVNFIKGDQDILSYTSGSSLCSSSYIISGTGISPVITVSGARAQPVKLDYCLRIKNISTSEIKDIKKNCSSLTSSGTVIPSISWLTQLGASTVASGGNNAGFDACTVLDVDYTGASYCAGYTNGAVGEANGGNYDGFLSKINADGSLAWIKQYGLNIFAPGGSNSNLDIFYALKVDRDLGHVYVGGEGDGALGEVIGGGGSDAFFY